MNCITYIIGGAWMHDWVYLHFRWRYLLDGRNIIHGVCIAVFDHITKGSGG